MLLPQALNRNTRLTMSLLSTFNIGCQLFFKTFFAAFKFEGENQKVEAVGIWKLSSPGF